MNKVTEIYLSNTLEIMGDGAFSGCTALESVTIPAKLKEIPLRAFYGCTNLSELDFAPDCQVTLISQYAFANCGLTYLSTPASLRRIDKSAFENCYNMQKLVLDGGVQILSMNAFNNCGNVKHVVLGESLTSSSGYNLFLDFPAIETVEIYTSAIRPNFSYHTSLKTLIVGGNAGSIPQCTGCTTLSSVVIKERVSGVGAYDLYGCTSLTSITFPDTFKWIGLGAFTYTGLTKLVLPASIGGLGERAIGYNIKEIVFTGDCPVFDSQTFIDSTVTVYYPADNVTWTEEKMQACIGNITWVPYTEAEREGLL